MTIRTDSISMGLFRSLGLESIAWSLRRLHCPVSREALVLEVGSGGNPYYRANVLLDAYEETRERHWVPLVSDRPTVLGFVENLPFRDKSFDFVIASHVLEHSTRPEVFLSELQRVAKSGYIEVPDAFMERVNPYRDHRLEITCRSGELVINKKGAWQVDPALVELYEHKVKRILTRETMRKHPFAFHVRYYWEDEIAFTVVNASVDSNWASPESQPGQVPSRRLRKIVAGWLVRIMRRLFSQHARNKSLVLEELLRCPACYGEKLEESVEGYTCSSCNKTFPLSNDIPVLIAN